MSALTYSNFDPYVCSGLSRCPPKEDLPTIHSIPVVKIITGDTLMAYWFKVLTTNCNTSSLDDRLIKA